MLDNNGDSATEKWKYVSLTLIMLIVVSSVLFTYAYLSMNSQLSDLRAEFSDVKSQLKGLNNKIQILEYLNTTTQLPLPQIFDMIQSSVVLITVNGVQGSGFIYDNDGHIVTNYHVIENAIEIGSSIEVTFLDGTVTTAEPIGGDIYSDLAVIKVSTLHEILQPVVLGNSSDLIVGEPIVAVGNPFGLSDTMTAGIVSQLGRQLGAEGGYVIIDVIQVDAAINPGNSGGPLVNMNGEVVGVNTAIVTDPGTQTFAGIGFAVPSDTVRRELPSLIKDGTYKHPWIGISGVDVTLDIAREIGLEKVQGFLIVDVVQGSPADAAGLKGGDIPFSTDGQEIMIGGDVIVGVDEFTVRNLDDLVVYIERNKLPGDAIQLTIIRDGGEMPTSLVLGERPPP